MGMAKGKRMDPNNFQSFLFSLSTPSNLIDFVCTLNETQCGNSDNYDWQTKVLWLQMIGIHLLAYVRSSM